MQANRPILRFVAVFVVLAAAFNVFYYAVIAHSRAFQSYLEVNAAASAAVMRLLGTDVSASGPQLIGPRITMTIALGCDAIQPASLFFFAVLASPVAFRAKWPGLLIGTALLIVLNLIRIVSLYYCKVHKPDWFESLHIDVWQTAFICLALLFWIIWALWAKRASTHETRAVA